MLKTSEVARKLGVSVRTVYKLIHDGKLQAINVCATSGRRTLRVTDDFIDLFLYSNNYEPDRNIIFPKSTVRSPGGAFEVRNRRQAPRTKSA